MYEFMDIDKIGIIQDKLQTQININTIQSKRIQILQERLEDTGYEYIEGQNNLIIYLRERINQMVHEGADYGDVVNFIQNVKPIFKHD